MSQENVEIVRRDYVAFDRGDFNAILEDVDPEVAIQAHPRGDEGKYEGKDGFLRFIREWIEPFEAFTQTPEEFIEAGDLVVVRVLQRARGKGSGVPVEGHFWLLHLMRDGKVIKLDLYDNETQALKAAGLSEYTETSALDEKRRDRQLPGSGPLKRRLSKFSTVRVVNPIVRGLLERGLFPKTHALLETTGRVSGKPRRTPVGNGLRGDKFWIVTEHGWAADYVKNIERNPRVRVKVGRSWHSGTAQILPEEDPRERLRKLHRPVNDSLLKAVGTEMLVIRVDLDDLAR